MSQIGSRAGNPNNAGAGVASAATLDTDARNDIAATTPRNTKAPTASIGNSDAGISSRESNAGAKPQAIPATEGMAAATINPAANRNAAIGTSSIGAGAKLGCAPSTAPGTSITPDFAALLAATNITGTTIPAAAIASEPANPATDPEAVDPAPTGQPDQLLALLSASWCMPVTVDTASTSKSPANEALPMPSPSSATAVQNPATQNLADALPSVTLPLAGSAPISLAAVAHAAASDITSAASDALSGPATGRKPGADPNAEPLLLDSATSTATATQAASMRGNVLPPTGMLALPNDIDGFGARIVWMTEQCADYVQGQALAEIASSKPGIDTSTTPPPFGNLTAAAAVSPASMPASVLPSVAALALPGDLDAGFDDGFGTRVAWMAEQRIGYAQIRLNPEHVGPIDVRVQLDGNRVSAEFHSAHADVRHAIEASMPRLREMLGQHGLQLGQADVGQRHSGHTHARAAQHGTDNSDPGATPETTRASAASTGLLRSRSLLDEYA